jgi:hypothetical protein
MPHPSHIEQPVEHNPGALVENVYALPGTTDMPDYESQDVMGEYLMDRFAPPEGPRTRVILNETGRTLPRLTHPVVGSRIARRWERDGWLISPKVAAGVWVGSALLSIAEPLALDVADEVRVAAHDVYRAVVPVEPHIEWVPGSETTHGPVRHIRVNAEAGNRAGSADIDHQAIDRFKGLVAKVVAKEGKVDSITITGRSSDDYGTNASIGRAESPAQDYADERAAAYVSALRDTKLPVAGHQNLFEHVKITPEIDQNVLTTAQKAKAEAAASEAGFTGPNNIIDAIHSVEAGQQPKGKLTRLINRLFTSKRGVSLDARVTMPGVDTHEPTLTPKIVPGADNPPNNPHRHYHPWFIPPFIPRFRRGAGQIKAVRQFQWVPGRRIMTPSILKEEVDQAWVRLRPEALNQDGSLIENPWAYTRKYEHLLRDGRIADLLRADYENAEGEKKSLRIMFVDKAPAQETLDAFEALLKKFAAMDGGKIADRISGIFVYQSENAGTWHRDPKRIAMGLDKQSSEHILGTYTYALDMVEMHMPSTWSPEELEEMLSSYMGPRWVLAHEVAGHGTDDSDEILKLRRVWSRDIPNAHVIDGEPRARKMRRLQGILRRLPRNLTEKTMPVQFDITYPVTDHNGRTVTMQARVTENDPRLAHATRSTIAGHQPTRYAGESVSEHYAETAAAVTTGDTIPYDEALVDVPRLTTDDGQTAVFATTYRPDVRGQRLFTDSVGGEAGSYPIGFANPPAVTVSHINPANDPLMRQELQRTRRLQTMRPDRMAAILVRVASHNHPAGK